MDFGIQEVADLISVFSQKLMVSDPNIRALTCFIINLFWVVDEKPVVIPNFLEYQHQRYELLIARQQDLFCIRCLGVNDKRISIRFATSAIASPTSYDKGSVNRFGFFA